MIDFKQLPDLTGFPTPNMPMAAVGGRNPAVEEQIRFVMNMAASNVIGLGYIYHSDVAVRVGMFLAQQINDTVFWSKLLIAVEGPV